jgi:phage portal protein BeeE
VVELFKHPHPTMDSQMFFEMLVTWLSLRGEFFVLPLDLADQPVDMSERKPRAISTDETCSSGAYTCNS